MGNLAHDWLTGSNVMVLLTPFKGIQDMSMQYAAAYPENQRELEQVMQGIQDLDDMRKIEAIVKETEKNVRTLQEELDFVKNIGRNSNWVATMLAHAMDEDMVQITPVCFRYIATRTLLVLEHTWRIFTSLETQPRGTSRPVTPEEPSGPEAEQRKALEREASSKGATRNLELEAQVIQYTLGIIRDNAIRDQREPAARVCETFIRACRIGMLQCAKAKDFPRRFGLKNTLFQSQLDAVVEKHANHLHMFLRIMMWHAEALRGYCRMSSPALAEFFGDIHSPLLPQDLVERTMATPLHRGVDDETARQLHREVVELRTNTDVLHAVGKFLRLHHYNERAYLHETTRGVRPLSLMERLGPFDSH